MRVTKELFDRYCAVMLMQPVIASRVMLRHSHRDTEKRLKWQDGEPVLQNLEWIDDTWTLFGPSIHGYEALKAFDEWVGHDALGELGLELLLYTEP